MDQVRIIVEILDQAESNGALTTTFEDGVIRITDSTGVESVDDLINMYEGLAALLKTYKENVDA